MRTVAARTACSHARWASAIADTEHALHGGATEARLASARVRVTVTSSRNDQRRGGVSMVTIVDTVRHGTCPFGAGRLSCASLLPVESGVDLVADPARVASVVCA